MEYVVIALIAVAIVAFISYPLFGRPRRLYHLEGAFEFADTKQRNYLNLRKARIEENLRELEFEYQMGKLSEQDYAGIRDGYTKEADEVTKALDKFKVRQEIENLIENEVRSRRRIK